jgi:hypothetical protein
VNAICTWPVEVSAGVLKFWLLPLFGHSIAAPPEAAPSLTTAKGENVLWPARLSSSTVSVVPPEDELLELDEELEELLLEDELELEELLEEELELLLDDELELLELDELLEDELELLLDEDELDVLEEVLLELLLVPSPAQVGAAKLPSWLPWKPKPVLWPGASACQLQQFMN